MQEPMQFTLIIFTTSELSGERANETKKLKEREREKEKNFRTEREKGDLDRKTIGECIASEWLRSTATVVNVYRIDSKAFPGSKCKYPVSRFRERALE